MKIKEIIYNLVPSLIKEKDGKISSRRAFKIIGGGSLITAGIMLTQSGDPSTMYVGVGLCALGVLSAWLSN